MNIRLCYVKKDYFIEHSYFINMLDPGNSHKQSRRTHLCLCIEKEKNRFFIPLRNNLGDALRKYGRIGHSVPSQKRDKAGFDFRYTLIVNDDKYIEWQDERKIPRTQYKRIENEYSVIKQEFEVYLNKYIKVAKKNRAEKEPLYRVSSLLNFNSELDINLR